MRKILILISAFLFLSSCNLDDGDSKNYSLKLLPIEEVEIPSSFLIGETYTITLKYFNPTDCYTLNGLYYDKHLNTRTIAVQALVRQDTNCEDTSDFLVETTFDFKAMNTGTYIFKFWHGKDLNNEDIFLEYEIPVND